MPTATINPRVAPLEPPYDPDTEAMLRKWMPPGSPLDPLALFRTLQVHDELASRMRPLGAGILAHGRITPRERELIIDRTCARAGAEYEWGVHVVAFGGAVGLSEAELAATAVAVADDPVWSPDDALLIRLAGELYETGDVSDPTWEALAERFANDQLLELIITAGWYRLISSVINVIRTAPEPWAARFP